MYSLGVTLLELTFDRQSYFYATASVEERLQAHQFQPVQFPKVDIILMLENSEHLQFMKKIEIVPQATDFLLLALSGLMLLMEVGCALFSKKRLALHDRLFCTRVTLDTRHGSSTK